MSGIRTYSCAPALIASGATFEGVAGGDRRPVAELLDTGGGLD